MPDNGDDAAPNVLFKANADVGHHRFECCDMVVQFDHEMLSEDSLVPVRREPQLQRLRLDGVGNCRIRDRQLINVGLHARHSRAQGLEFLREELDRHWCRYWERDERPVLLLSDFPSEHVITHHSSLSV